MKNPWIEFLQGKQNHRFHKLDAEHAFSFNSAIGGRKSFELASHLEPFPYLGNPKAPVLVLLANPGKSAKENSKTFKFSKSKLKLANANLLHKGTDDLKMRLHSPNDKTLESPWFKARTSKLVEATSLDAVSKNLFFVNFHAYHSKSWYPIPFTFHTQHYSFELVRKAIARDAYILMSRNTLGWLTAIPELVDYKNVGTFKSSRSVYISEGNLGKKVFKEVVRRIS